MEIASDLHVIVQLGSRVLVDYSPSLVYQGLGSPFQHVLLPLHIHPRLERVKLLLELGVLQEIPLVLDHQPSDHSRERSEQNESNHQAGPSREAAERRRLFLIIVENDIPPSYRIPVLSAGLLPPQFTLVPESVTIYLPPS